MTANNHDRLLATIAVHLHSASICTIGQGWRLSFAPFEAVTVHHVLAGTGIVQVGNASPLPYSPGSVIVVPPRQGHVVGDPRPEARQVDAEDHCGAFADGLAAFTAGDGPGTVLLCGSIPAPHGRALGLFDLLTKAAVETPADEVGRGVFDLMRAEIALPGLGTAAMTEALMKACLVALLRGRLRREDHGAPSAALPGDPRLARAVLAVLENPGASHTVASLADKAGMSRASFADHFARVLGSGPMEFVQSVRLRAAARLLGTTDLPLKVVAAAVGYADPSSLSRAFRGTYGTDPTTYRSLAVHAWPEPLEAGLDGPSCANTARRTPAKPPT
ncbi:AraC family transcriptional regulator [Muricoccus pecuniae]|uniref:AraC-like DNA-binding protein n=1 Tax=Muricoccus pecuniae TaxID=693023 RepID=A0A840YMG0_9PROT|nr:AraC family transcriptional regulator [Roseomonas pecuniae]MBB5696552.1 AraC-like DNA-binding protein [Roseomonas pecuniae]